jgi:FkbM family methyltransferase
VNRLPKEIANLLSHANALPAATDVQTDVGELWSHPDDLVTSQLQRDGCWEPPLARLLRKRLRPGMTFLDIGAHIGYFTILAATLVGPTGHVFAVEPDPGNAPLLRANLWRHRCGNVTFLPIAAWHSLGHVWLTTNPDNRAGSTVQQQYREGDVGVPAAPLDTLLDESFDLIKADAEGSDHIALQGAERLLSRCPLAVVEFWPQTVVNETEPREVLNTYHGLGRNLSLLSETGDLEPTTTDELLEQGPGYVELALVPRTD